MFAGLPNQSPLLTMHSFFEFSQTFTSVSITPRREKGKQLANFDYQNLYNNQINARALIGQSAVVIVPVNPRKNRASSELLYKSNKPQVFYGL